MASLCAKVSGGPGLQVQGHIRVTSGVVWKSACGAECGESPAQRPDSKVTLIGGGQSSSCFPLPAVGLSKGPPGAPGIAGRASWS